MYVCVCHLSYSYNEANADGSDDGIDFEEFLDYMQKRKKVQEGKAGIIAAFRELSGSKTDIARADFEGFPDILSDDDISFFFNRFEAGRGKSENQSNYAAFVDIWHCEPYTEPVEASAGSENVAKSVAVVESAPTAAAATVDEEEEAITAVVLDNTPEFAVVEV